MTPDGTLVIRNMGPKDAGTYGCLASNVAGTDKQTAIVSYIGEITGFTHLKDAVSKCFGLHFTRRYHLETLVWSLPLNNKKQYLIHLAIIFFLLK